MTDMTNPLEGLTDLEREQLRYIVERVPEWPEGCDSVWVTRDGRVVASDDSHEDGYQIKHHAYKVPRWPTYSPDFTRTQYDAMKAELSAKPECACVSCVVCGNEMSPFQWQNHAACPVCAAPHDCIAGDIATTPINYRAYAEALAELLTIARCPDASCDNNGTTVHETVSTTIGCCGIYLPDGQCCGNGVPEAVQDMEPAPCQWCHERTKALAAFDRDREMNND